MARILGTTMIGTLQSTRKTVGVRYVLGLYLCGVQLHRRWATKMLFVFQSIKPNTNDYEKFKYVPPKFTLALILLRPFRLFQGYIQGVSKL